MNIDVTRKELIHFIKHTPPDITINSKLVQQCGRFVLDTWIWNIDFDDDLCDEELYYIYTRCRDS